MSVPLRVSVIVVNTNDGKYIEHCLASLERAGGYHEILVVDHASTDGSPERIEAAFPRVRLVRAGKNLGFAGGNNLGASLATGDALVLFNPDAFATPGWIAPLAAVLTEDRVAIASPKIYRGLPGTSTTIDSAGCDIEFPLGEGPPRGYLELDAGRFEEPADVAYASGAAFAILRETYGMLGGLDESFFCYAEESDLCWRARLRGLRCVYVPNALVYHIGSANFGARSPRKIYFQTRNRIRMCLQNYAGRNVPAFVATELIHGTCVMAAAPFFPAYRALGGAYARAWVGVARCLPLIARTRALRQRERTVGDDVVLRLHRRVGIVATLLRYRRMTRQKAASLFNPGVKLSA
jgi:GT2 family glycosyltransferase